MNTNNQLVQCKDTSIRKWLTNIISKIKSKFVSSKMWDKEIEVEINKNFPDESKQKEAKELLQELLMRNNDLLETLDIRMLDKDLVDFNERISNLYPSSCENLSLEELQNLSEDERLKAISIILSNSEFYLNDLSELKDYYEKRKELCKQIINNPKIATEEYEKNIDLEKVSIFPFGFLYEMKDLNELDRIKYGIIAAKYGMNLEKAKTG